MIRKHYHITGEVQHVGFRWRARKAAAMFHCTGWCRNEQDGSVTMELQGSRLHICLVILAMRFSRRIRITDMKVIRKDPIPEEKEFRAEY